MDTSKDSGLLTRFTRIRKKPQQPLKDLTDLYSRIANESIYFLKLEEKCEYRKAVSGWKALNTHVLYELTQIEHQHPNTQNYTKDEISIQNGVRELFHRSLQHLERVAQLEKQNEMPLADAAARTERSFSKRPVPPSTGSRPMLKTLRTPRFGQYHKNYTVSAPSIANNTGTSSSGNSNSFTNGNNGNKINFSTSKPLKNDGAFKEFDEHHQLVEFSEDDSSSTKSGSRLEDDAKSDQTFEFDVQDYFEDYLDVDQEELKRLEALNSLEGLQKDTKALSMETRPLSPERRQNNVALEHTQSTPALVQKKPVAKTTKFPIPKLPTSMTPLKSGSLKYGLPAPGLRRPQKKQVSDLLTKGRPVASTAQSTPAVRTRSAPLTTKEPPLVNRRVVRNGKPTAATKPVVASKPAAARSMENIKRPQALRAVKPAQQKAVGVDQRKNPSIQASTPPKSVEDRVSSPKEKEVDVVDKKMLKEALEDDIIAQLRGVDEAAAKQIFSEIVVRGDEVHWDDIAGLEAAKYSLKEAVVYPFLRPDLFRGLREPVRGMLLFGPPGTGKTMLARAVATESNSTFFSISASSLTSKYLGESEKLVRALFAIAKKLSPSIVFVDEIDSIMGSRNNDGENESSRRIKNEFLVQWSSLSSAAAGKKGSQTENGDDDGNDEEDERVLVLAATNLPWSIDEAARRRFVRRQYIPLPELETRKKQLSKLLMHQKHTLTDDDFEEVLKLTDGYSGSDITSLAKDAAMGPLRELGDKLLSTPRDQIRAIALQDLKNSLSYIKPSVSADGLEQYENWAQKFGSSGV
ncbi:LAME_0A02322g1_1 [Lachancea meyersii CBS 8951]|uniref:LAME_0A02322g1_1 n=1 Tax=Lachancea meyersii CBS 8951 TaxID=1266667 RepID=A0A1G4IMG3_9SACH|nr:LAME_0A02322g1_1 [Lachancea meyersii CBS 8951]